MENSKFLCMTKKAKFFTDSYTYGTYNIVILNAFDINKYFLNILNTQACRIVQNKIFKNFQKFQINFILLRLVSAPLCFMTMKGVAVQLYVIFWFFKTIMVNKMAKILAQLKSINKKVCSTEFEQSAFVKSRLEDSVFKLAAHLRRF